MTFIFLKTEANKKQTTCLSENQPSQTAIDIKYARYDQETPDLNIAPAFYISALGIISLIVLHLRKKIIPQHYEKINQPVE